MLFRQLFDKTSSTFTYVIASAIGREAVVIDPVLENVEKYIEEELHFESKKENPAIQVLTIPSNLENQQIAVTIEGAESETWFDVSMYPLKQKPNPKDIDFDFDWLFTNSGGEENYHFAVSKLALVDTHEAVAQLVSWSNPIETDQ